MKYAFTLALIGIAQLYFAREAGPWGWLLAWSGLSWLLVGAAYQPIGPRVFGKRVDGTMAGVNVALLLPYLAVTWGLWEIQKRLSREERSHEIVKGLWLGRRCSESELPPGTMLVADLTAEFGEPRKVRTGRGYICLPTMDAAAPSLPEFERMVSAITACPGAVYVHCALGHGRSATVVAAALIARADAASVEEAIQKTKTARPGIEINAAQRDLLDRWVSSRPSPETSQ
ncbi:MAG: dual specificity protein phosphatase family protein [Capsulimonas sp.]|uniref:dual specificity protein phosphatase family protein n=1 Tax=Capsulimonas sp. TaxID=2494211 RepID=UPI00326516D0